jgi:tRNA A37 N6-isopentenylltransferase MiaA
LPRVGSSIGAPSRLAGKSLAVAPGQRRRAEQRDVELAQAVAEHLEVAAVRRRPVGQHHVEAVQREFREQGVELAFAADQPHLLRQVEHRFHQAVGDQLGQGIGNADGQAQRVRRIGFAQRGIHAFAELEDLVGVGQRQAPGFGRHQAPALRRQQRLAQRLFEPGDLHADRLHRHAEAPRGARDTAFAGDDPEVAQVVEVQRGRFHFRILRS